MVVLKIGLAALRLGLADQAAALADRVEPLQLPQARKVLGLPKSCELAHAFLWEHSQRRLELAQLLGQLGGWRLSHFSSAAISPPPLASARCAPAMPFAISIVLLQIWFPTVAPQPAVTTPAQPGGPKGTWLPLDPVPTQREVGRNPTCVQSRGQGGRAAPPGPA